MADSKPTQHNIQENIVEILPRSQAEFVNPSNYFCSQKWFGFCSQVVSRMGNPHKIDIVLFGEMLPDSALYQRTKQTTWHLTPHLYMICQAATPRRASKEFEGPAH